MEEAVLDSVELPPAGTAMLSLPLPSAYVIVFEPVTHAAHFLDVKGEPTRERQSISIVYSDVRAPMGAVQLRPGPLRLALENRTSQRLLPAVWITGTAMHHLLSKRRPFLTAKRLLSNQTFRDIYRTDTLDLDQRLKITSLTFLFTDLRGSTALYQRVGDLAAYELVRRHFDALTKVTAAWGGAIVKTIGDAVMATFPTPDRAVAAALGMREMMGKLNEERGREDLLLKDWHPRRTLPCGNAERPRGLFWPRRERCCSGPSSCRLPRDFCHSVCHGEPGDIETAEDQRP